MLFVLPALITLWQLFYLRTHAIEYVWFIRIGKTTDASLVCFCNSVVSKDNCIAASLVQLCQSSRLLSCWENLAYTQQLQPYQTPLVKYHSLPRQTRLKSLGCPNNSLFCSVCIVRNLVPYLTRTVARKSSIGGLYVRAEGLDIQI